MELNIQWPEKRKLTKDMNMFYLNYDKGYNHCLAECKQAVEKALEDAEKETNSNIVLKNEPCDVCGKIHNCFPSSCGSNEKLSFYGKDKRVG